jgi:ATP/maltotriose-dependent transcriptional regulator MalT
VLECLSGELCDGVTGRAGSQAMLGDIERAGLVLVPLVERHVETLLGRSEGATLRRWLTALPAESVRGRPRLRLAQAYGAAVGFQVEALEALLDDAERARKLAQGKGRRAALWSNAFDHKAAGEADWVLLAGAILAAVFALLASACTAPGELRSIGWLRLFCPDWRQGDGKAGGSGEFPGG